MKINLQAMHLPGVALLSCAVLMPAIASAQSGESRYALEEVTVTARRMEEGLQNAPLSVTAFTGQELENRGALDIIDMAGAAPNVTFERDGDISGFGAAPRVSIRGIGQSDFVLNTDPAVGIYADGVYLGRSMGSVLDLMDVERAEALRGPQGTLFGRNSTGGAINIISKRPDVGGPFAGYAAVDVGENGYLNIRTAMNIPMSDKVAGRVSFMARERDGFVPALQYDNYDLGGEDVKGIRGSLRFLASDNFTIDVDADYSERRDTAAAAYPVLLGNLGAPESDLDSPVNVGGSTSIFARIFNRELPIGPPTINPYKSTDPLCSSNQAYRDATPACDGNFWAGSRDGTNALWVDNNGNPFEPTQKLDVYGYSVRLTWDTEAFTIATISAWRGFDSQFYNGAPQPVSLHSNNNEIFNQDQMSQEIQITGSAFNERFDWLAGLYYFEEDGYEQVQVIAPTVPTSFGNDTDFLPLGNIQNRYVDNTSKAIFGQGIIHFTDAIALTLGARYTDDKKDAQFILFNDNFVDPTEFVGLQEATETNYLANLAWQASEQTLVYLQYSDGFRDGGFPSRQAADSVALALYDPEYVEAWEIGLKTTVLDERLRVNLSFFNTSYTDMQVAATAINPTPGTTAPNVDNLGDSTLKGFEIEANYLATDNLRFDLGIGYLDDTIDSLVTGGLILNNGLNVRKEVTTDNQLAFTPTWQIAAGMNYSWFSSSDSEIRTRFDYIYESGAYGTIANYDQDYTPSRWTINANASYIPADANWQIQIGARNLTDEENIVRAFINPGLGASTNHYPMRGREAYIQLRYDWGE